MGKQRVDKVTFYITRWPMASAAPFGTFRNTVPAHAGLPSTVLR